MNRKNFKAIKMNMSSILPQFVSYGIVFIAVVFCLTTIPAWTDETSESEKKDAEVVKETEQSPEESKKDDNSSTKNTDKTSSKGEEEPKKQDDVAVIVTKEIIEGTSDEMERFEKDGITILIGNAKTQRYNEKREMIGFLNADKITLKSDPDTGETVEIVAEGNVEIRDNKIFATSDHAKMDNLTSIITLKDNVVVLQKEDRLETKLFTFNRLTGKQTGVGGVKFKVAVTQTTPISPPENAEEDGAGTSDNTDEKKTSPDTEKENETKSNSKADNPVSEEKSDTPETEKKEAESSDESKSEETEPTESEETESAETEETEETEQPESDAGTETPEETE